MAIAGAKAVLIVLFFMHALHSHRLTLVICLASLLWLSIMLALTLSDYRTRTRSDHQSRGWVDIPGK
jgi:cytochrome c oxidase subunit IV